VTKPDFIRIPIPLEQAEITIIGLGLMGGSLALALRGKCRQLTGYDPDPETRTFATQNNIVDQVVQDPEAALTGAQIVILAAPIRGILEWIMRLSRHPDPAFVIDIGSTKVEICRALGGLPAHQAPVGGHPMCGKEVGGITQADPAIYLGAPFSFSRLPNSTTAGCQVAEALAEAVGAYPVWVDPETHDHWTAATSHTPYLLSGALIRGTPLEAAPLIGPGFRSTTRLAGSSPGMMVDILGTNRPAILAALRRVRDQIELLEPLLEKEDQGPLYRWLVEAQGQYDLLLG
jgi:prephenate dehydrogenase